MVIYFSGTGNSRWCAQRAAYRLEDKLLDAKEYIKNGIAAELNSEAPWVFVCPVYAWQAPKVFTDFICAAAFNGSKKAWFILTCGGDMGAAGEYLRALCAEKGLEYMGACEVVMPENFVAMFSVPDEDTCAKILAKAAPLVDACAERVRSGEAFAEKKVNALDRLKSGPVNMGFNRFFIKADPFRATSACTGCGLCAEKCPLGNIELKDGLPHWGEKCTQCMACICLCPAEAIEYGRRSKGKRRYQCPEFKPE